MDQIPKVDWLAKVCEEKPHLDEIATQHAEMVRMAILAGERDRAVGIIAMAFDCIQENVIQIDSPVVAVAGERAGAILEKNAGIKTVRQLCKRSFNELLAIRHIDYMTVGRIADRLEKFGFQLKK